MRYKGEQAIGLIETIGMVPALLAADAMYPPLCQSPLLRHAHTLWTSPFVRNRYVHEPQSAEWSTFGQEDSRDLRFSRPPVRNCYVREFSTGDCSVIGQRAASQLGFCRAACPKNATLGDYGLASGAFSDTLGCARPCCSCRPCLHGWCARPCLLVLPMLAQSAHAYLCRPPVGCPARQIGS